jgi:hypothetical protein
MARDQPEHVRCEVRLEHKDDLIDGVALFEAAESVNEQGHAAQLEHLFRAVGVHAGANACGGDYGDV